jgi:hypothetical protein
MSTSNQGVNMRVKISDWSNPRVVYEKNGKLFLQVAAGCIDCPICKSRIEFVSMRLHRSRVQHDVIANEQRTVVDIGLPMPTAGTDVTGYLQEILALPVSKA